MDFISNVNEYYEYVREKIKTINSDSYTYMLYRDFITYRDLNNDLINQIIFSTVGNNDEEEIYFLISKAKTFYYNSLYFIMSSASDEVFKFFMNKLIYQENFIELINKGIKDSKNTDLACNKNHNYLISYKKKFEKLVKEELLEKMISDLANIVWSYLD